jgi:hypothetical protein
LIDDDDEDDEDFAAAAAAEPPPEPATTVYTACPLAIEEVLFPSDPDPDSEPACTDIVSLADNPLAVPFIIPFEPPIASVPFPSAWTVTALPTALVVVAARPPGVKVAESTAGPLEEDASAMAASALELCGASPSADTVTGAKAPLFAEEPADAEAAAISADVVSSAAICGVLVLMRDQN